MKFATILKWAAIAFLCAWFTMQPHSAEHLVHNIGNFLSEAAHGLTNFWTSI